MCIGLVEQLVLAEVVVLLVLSPRYVHARRNSSVPYMWQVFAAYSILCAFLSVDVFVQFDVELIQEIETLIGRKLEEYEVDEDTVLKGITKVR